MTACDPFSNPRYGEVSFSSDTLFFDTVFTGTGSVTMELRAVNRGRNPILLDEIFLEGGRESSFRLNINGKPSLQEHDIVLPAGDSIFIFVDVNITPGDDISPVLVSDAVVFESGGSISSVVLEAWGQDIWLRGDEILYDEVWTEGKPYVVSGSLFVDTACTLTLAPGTRLFFHHNASMTVAGALICSGTCEKPVIIGSARTDPAYEDVPGQWRGIQFLDCSRGNMLINTQLRNAETALKITSGPAGTPDITITDSKVMHNSVSSLVASGASVFAANSVFAHTGFSTISLSDGGIFTMIHCTVANIWEYDFRTVPAFTATRGTSHLPVVSITNSVISGSRDTEFSAEASPAELELFIYADSSFIKIDTTRSTWWNGRVFREVEVSGNPRFIEEPLYDYRPDTLSPLLNKAGMHDAVSWPLDIRHKPRPTGAGSDIGAYERQPGERKKKI